MGYNSNCEYGVIITKVHDIDGSIQIHTGDIGDNFDYSATFVNFLQLYDDQVFYGFQAQRQSGTSTLIGIG